MIRQTAEILTSSFRAEDVVGRLGGDEFCVFYTGQNDVDTLGCKAAQICEAVRHIHPAQNGGPGTSVSIGIARRESGDDFDSLYRKADAALYQRKEALGAMATRSTAMAPIPKQKTGLEQKRRFLFQACPV